MKITVKTGLLVGVCWVAIKMLFYWIDVKDSLVPLTFINMFCLLLSISIGLFLDRKSKNYSTTSAMDDMKAGMQAGIPYTIIVVLFISFFYSKIDPSVISEMKNNRLVEYQKILDDPNKLKELKKSKQEFEVMTKEEIYQEMEKSTNSVMSTRAITLVTLLSLVILTTFYSLLVTIIYRKVLFKNS